MTQIRSMRSDLGRARGLGSSHEGAHHWRAQRLTAVLLVPLGLWFVASVVYLIGLDVSPSVFRAWIAEHGNALLLIMFVVVLFHHTVLGMQVVIEDYVHGPVAKTVSLFLSKTVLWALGASSVLAVLYLYLGA